MSDQFAAPRSGNMSACMRPITVNTMPSITTRMPFDQFGPRFTHQG